MNATHAPLEQRDAVRHDDGSWDAMRWLLRAQLEALVWLFGLAVAATSAVTLLLVLRFDVEMSLWEFVVQVGRWWGVAIAAYSAYVYVPLFLVHGHTRRSAGRQLAVFVVAFALALAGLLLVGYGIERLVLGLAGADAAAVHADRTIFDHGAWLAFPRLAVSVLSWAAAAAVAAFGVYRGELKGTVLMVVAVFLGLGGELLARTGTFDVLDELLPFQPLVFALGSLVVVAALARLGWSLLRDLALNPR